MHENLKKTIKKSDGSEKNQLYTQNIHGKYPCILYYFELKLHISKMRHETRKLVGVTVGLLEPMLSNIAVDRHPIIFSSKFFVNMKVLIEVVCFPAIPLKLLTFEILKETIECFYRCLVEV